MIMPSVDSPSCRPKPPLCDPSPTLPLQDLPALGICGWSGSGKTTLIEALIPLLLSRGIRLAVIKHDAHGIQVDRPGKDSDRFFRAGADVWVQSPTEDFIRVHPAGNRSLAATLRDMCPGYDLVLVEGHKSTPLPKLWICADGEEGPPPEVNAVLASLPRGGGRLEAALPLIEKYLAAQWFRPPLYGAVMVPRGTGHQDIAGLRQAMEAIKPLAVRLAVIADPDVPPCTLPAGLPPHARLSSVPDVTPWMGSALAALRWAPRACWLMTFYRAGSVCGSHLEWLLSRRRPGLWAIVPRPVVAPDSASPVVAYLDWRARSLLEETIEEPGSNLSVIAGPRLSTPRLLRKRLRNRAAGACCSCR